jgi:hypothetical protein
MTLCFLVAVVRTDVSDNISPPYSQQISAIDTAMRTSQKTVFFHPTEYPSKERLTRSESMVTPLWRPISLRTPEEGSYMLSEPHGSNSKKTAIIGAAVKTSQNTVFFGPTYNGVQFVGSQPTFRRTILLHIQGLRMSEEESNMR